jgi:hypothetical protein
LPKIILAIFVFIVAIVYIFWRFDAIIQDGETQLDTAMIAVAIIIILMPFISEIELFGLRFKKEVADLKRELDEKIKTIDQKIFTMQSQNITQNFYPPKTDEELRRLSETAHSITASSDNKNQPEVATYIVPPEIVKLFTVRWKLRKSLNALHLTIHTNVQNGKRKEGDIDTKQSVSISRENMLKISTHGLIEHLTIIGRLHPEISDILREMVIICDNAYFGYKISKEQIDFVNENEYVIEHI